MERRAFDFPDCSLQVKPRSRGHQVVSAAASAELSGQRPDFLFKARFHPSVDVLRPSACRPIRMRPNGAPHSLEASEELSHFAGLENADSAELSHKRRV